jgi:transposase InsO family protein
MTQLFSLCPAAASSVSRGTALPRSPANQSRPACLSRTWQPTSCRTATNQLWIADLIYTANPGGFVHLATVLDAWSRKDVGYAVCR